MDGAPSVVRLYLEPAVDGRTRQSEPMRGPQPALDDTFKFPVSWDQLSGRTLRLELRPEDCTDILGEARIALAELDVATPVDIWMEVAKFDKERQERPELLISLSYLPSAGRMTVVILKGRNLYAPDSKDLPDPCAKVSLAVGERKPKKKKSTTKRGTSAPEWHEPLTWDLAEDEVFESQLVVTVVNCRAQGHPVLGSCVLGAGQKGPGGAQWRDMAAHPRKTVALWQPLRA
ncbi:Syt13 [Cordylochernes scorpioides]|uniref:Syt13 n=1 Tax=Cordylochernes scorpioides TaxID=51811 RepID=A0ABY6L8L1_9ARAC|nr:Syt13 [Cordylochernes scorpioides]